MRLPTLANRPTTGRRTSLLAALFLAGILAIAFFPAIFDGRTLLHASWDAPSVMSTGAYDDGVRPIRLQRTSDPGAPAWQNEAWYKLISHEFWTEFTVPLWNPYNGYGTPLLADAISQPFFPLTTLLSLHVTPWTNSLFVVSRLFVGGLLMFLFARQFLSALPSLFAAVTFMLTGYFIIYLNIAHLSLEVLIPGIFLTFELIARRNSWSAVALAALMIFLANAGGMPESLFLVMAFASLYFVCRVVFTPELRARAISLLIKFVAAVVLGFALSGFLLLPFFEFLRAAHDVHQPTNVGGLQGGLGADGSYRATLQYLLPLIFGPVLGSIFSAGPAWSGLRGYWGIIPFFFSLVALLVLFSRKRMAGSRADRFLTIFFAATLVLMVLKRFGNVLVNWVGGLPLAEMVVFPKYQEPLIAFCVAMLGARGFATVVERRADSRHLIAAALVTLAIILSLAATFFPAVRLLATKTVVFLWFGVKVSLFYYVSIVCGVALVIVLAVLVLYAQRASGERRTILLRGTVVLLSLELLLTFLVPSFYLLSSLPPVSADPYKGAPYIDFIRANNTDHSRIFAREAILYANWSSAFGLADVRNIDALNVRRYRNFVRGFLLPPYAADRHNGDLADRFTGDEFAYEFDSDVEKRFLALSSIKYLITGSDLGFSPKWLNEIVEQHRSENLWGFGADVFHIGDPTTSTVRGLFQHPPSSRVSYKTVIDPKTPVFEALAVIKKEAFAGSDGVGFRLELKDGDRIDTLFETLLDPRDVPADRAGRPIRIDLSRYAGREVQLLFSTDPGPAGNASADWAGWAALRFIPADEKQTTVAFNKIYQNEVGIYQAPWVLPRAALYSAIELVADSDVLARLKNPAFDPNQKAIVSRESLTSEEAATAQPLAAAAGSALRAASITEYRSRYVRIEAESAGPSLLVLNDTNYPGWRAFVNGQPSPIVSANYLFRGVFVPASKSVVEFRYEPRSFQAGLALSLGALVILSGLVFWERCKRRPVTRREELH